MPRKVVRLEELRGWEGVRDPPIWPDLTLHALLYMPGKYWGMILAVFLAGYHAPPIVRFALDLIKSQE